MSNDLRQTMLYDAQKKSVGVSYVLWLFLGGFGGHRFYNGRTGTAVALLLLSLVGWSTIFVGFGFLPLTIVGVWVLVDAFLIPGWVRDHNTVLAGALSGA